MIRVGFIGTGRISTVHLRYLKTQPDVTIVALCDVSPDNLKQRQREFGGTPYHDFRQMLAHESLDAVWLCTPPQVRLEPLIACAARAIPVFCEKPVERDLNRARLIADQLAHHNARIMIGYPFRCLPLIPHIRRVLAEDRVHLVTSLYACPMSLDRSFPAWFFDKNLSGGALVDQATHNLDLLRSLLGEVSHVAGIAANPVSPKSPSYSIDETIALTLFFHAGITATHVHSWVADKWRNEITFSAEKHFLRLDLFAGTLQIQSPTGDTLLSYNPNHLYHFENEQFLAMLRSGDWSSNPCTFHDALRTLELTLRCDAVLTPMSPH
ncbi:MAG: Gfo/Idh/MocA family oxidoreductase [bacterium]|nr:Gfo/Idh/MocA family oxidoreductase [bacterium]